MRAINFSVLALSGLLLAACEALPVAEPSYEQAVTGNLFNTVNYHAATELMKRYPAPASASNAPGGSSGAPFIVATLVNIDQLEQSSTLGRLVSEQIASRLTQLGHGVVELKVRNGIYMKRNEGEFLLTREIKEIASVHQAQAVIVGTYAESANLVYVNLKAVNPANSMILAAYDYALPLDAQIRSMVRKTSRK